MFEGAKPEKLGKAMVFSLSRTLVPAVLAAACAASNAESPLAASSRPKFGPAGAAERDVGVGLADARWGVLESKRFALDVPLPERAHWVIEEAGAPWLVARHAASRSELRLRTWRAPRTVTPDDCEAQARLWRPSLPPISEDTRVEERSITAPAGYSTVVHVGVRAVDGELEGFALAFGATIGRCFAAAYTTRASGPGAEDAVAKRLALVVDGALVRTSERSIDDRVYEQR